ncbi:N-acetylglucosamine 6-phosphate deacetylase [Chitinophaga costaii]|uniref:N-acetylglucosamine 6-phosphate deacetylase n=1 Tax=Chitinophaga costaii TaxID=1335309 RepID=A0A1C4FPG3_9BACT|nr:N-acetylglucosamine-6-phosphate deacetylase [Chitinophaga costaii]PUZ20435.1 N-acetylglucosamine-6-phosphate deacetylase [Chitinophaga costaii]SCC57860.1 N-acetylglucosamine 6-phosphate deacetylase [Chitinophaga costaii]
MLTAYHNARIFTGEVFVQDHAVLVADKRVVAVLQVSAIPAGAEQIDLQGALLAPAFIDLQIYGGNGRLLMQQPDVATIKATYAYCLAGGASHFMITLPTTSFEIMEQGMQAISDYWTQGGQGCLGLHLEGPFMNPVKKGAHLEKYIKQPTAADIDWILEKGKSTVKYMTLAPERCDPALVARLQAAGIVISAGHSNATYAEAILSFQRGIPAATHLFNAMSALQGREPGMVGAIYDHPRVAVSVVADGVHVDFNSIRISKQILGDRLFLITDAVTENAAGDYIYVFREDRYVTGQGVLAGSCLTQLQGVKNCVEKVGLSLAESLRMASLYPARVAGLHSMGRIAPGYNAHFVVLDAALQLKEVIV